MRSRLEIQNHPDTQQRIAAWLSRPERPSGTLDVPELGTCLATNIGLVREENQDRVIAARFLSPIADESFFVVAIADGMGGLKDGGLCASLALSVLVASVLSSEHSEDLRTLVLATNAANNAVFDRYRERGGTTLNAVLFTRRGMTSCSVGDSRLYQLSRSSLEQISEDDSISAELGRIKPELQKSVDMGAFGSHLTQYVGMGPGLEPHVYRVVKDSPTLLLTTDGIHRIDNSVLSNVASNARNRVELANRLIHIANWVGGRDNASVAAISIESLDWIEDLNRSGSPNLEMWDSFGKYELAFAPIREQKKDRPLVIASGARAEREHPLDSKPSPSKRKRDRKTEKKPRSTGDVQISFVDYPLSGDKQHAGTSQGSESPADKDEQQDQPSSTITSGSDQNISEEKHWPGADREQSK